jgi:hypothetical protein
MLDLGVRPERIIELERADARRVALEDAARHIEALQGNELYQKAWKAAASCVRQLMVKQRQPVVNCVSNESGVQT